MIADARMVDEIREYLGVDSPIHLSLKGMLHCVNCGESRLCDACFSGGYPIAIDPDFHKTAVERGQLGLFETIDEQKKTPR